MRLKTSQKSRSHPSRPGAGRSQAGLQKILIALGGNRPGPLGPPIVGLRAVRALLPRAGLKVKAVSPLYWTRTEGKGYGPDFFNGVMACAGSCPPERLLARLHQLEERYGRVRTAGPNPRPLDLDLIDHQGRVRRGRVRRGRVRRGLHLPHPEAHDRLFVLKPLQDAVPFWRAPPDGVPLGRLLRPLAGVAARGGVKGPFPLRPGRRALR